MKRDKKTYLIISKKKRKGKVIIKCNKNEKRFESEDYDKTKIEMVIKVFQ